MICAPGLIFSGTEGVGSYFPVLCAQTHFRRYRGRRVLFSCFALQDSFSAVPRASHPVFLFPAPGHVYGRTEGVEFCFHVLCSRTRLRRQRASGQFFMFCAPELVFGGTEGVVSRFLILCSWTHFRRYRGRRVPFSCFARPGSFSVVPMASSPVFMF
jgi:hypothetical protein